MNTNNNERTTSTLHVFSDFIEANKCKNKLAENGIESFLQEGNVVGLNPWGGVELIVFTDELEAAKKIMISE
jgi:hypothetical protein